SHDAHGPDAGALAVQVRREAEVLPAARLEFLLQAEDGIRDRTVTGVQTCALPIYDDLTSSPPSSGLSPAVSLECPTECWQLTIRVALVMGLNPTSHDTS